MDKALKRRLFVDNAVRFPKQATLAPKTGADETDDMPLARRQVGIKNILADLIHDVRKYERGRRIGESRQRAACQYLYEHLTPWLRQLDIYDERGGWSYNTAGAAFARIASRFLSFNSDYEEQVTEAYHAFDLMLLGGQDEDNYVYDCLRSWKHQLFHLRNSINHYKDLHIALNRPPLRNEPEVEGDALSGGDESDDTIIWSLPAREFDGAD